ncbi:MAG: hypothetical protein ACOZBH_02245 [Patescibacteria group bacterium]
MKWHQVYNAARITTDQVSLSKLMGFDLIELELLHVTKKGKRSFRAASCPKRLLVFVRQIEIIGDRLFPNGSCLDITIELKPADKPKGFADLFGEFDREIYPLRFDNKLCCFMLPEKMFIDTHAPRDVFKDWTATQSR